MFRSPVAGSIRARASFRRSATALALPSSRRRAACSRMHEGAHAQCRRRSAGVRCSDEPHRQESRWRFPGGVTATIDNGTLSVKGPKGTLTLGLSDPDRLQGRRRRDSRSKPANDTRQARAFWGMQPHAGIEPDRRRDCGPHQDAGHQGCRLSCQTRKVAISSCSLGYSHDVDLPVAGRPPR